MTYDQALKIAEQQMLDLLQSGNEEVYEAARGADGSIDKVKLISASIRATKRLAEQILQDHNRR